MDAYEFCDVLAIPGFVLSPARLNSTSAGFVFL